MSSHLSEAWRTVAPSRGNPHGPLPALLVLLTVVTGLVDAFSYLDLGRVFVANMTGNVIFLAFALGGAAGFIWWASLLAIATFSIGALLGGRIAHAGGGHRGRHLLVASAIQGTIVLASFLVAVSSPEPYGTADIAVLVVLLGIGMGLQNATARALAVPDLTTTVLTLTLTGISADSAPARGSGSRLGRRAVSIASMFLGGLIGALLVETGHSSWVLLLATVLLAVIVAVTIPAAHSTEAWTAKR